MYNYDEDTRTYVYKPEESNFSENKTSDIGNDYIPNKEIIDLFNENKALFSIEADCSVYPNGETELFYRDLMSINKGEVILFANNVKKGQGAGKIAISDWGIRVCRFQKNYYKAWKELDSVSLISSYNIWRGLDFQFVDKSGNQELIPVNLIPPAYDLYISDICCLLQKIINQSKSDNPDNSLPDIEITNRQRVIDVFDYKKRELWWKGKNDGDSMDRPNIKGEPFFRTHFNVGNDETLLYCRDTSFWNEKNQGCVVTDWGIRAITDNDKPEDLIKFSWEAVADVTTEEYLIYFWGSKEHNLDNCAILPYSLFFKGEFDIPSLLKLFNLFAEASTPQKHPAEVILEQMNEVEETDPHKAWQLGSELLGKYEEWNSLIQWELGRIAYHYLQDQNKALKMLTEYLKGVDDASSSLTSLANYWCSNILYQKDNNQPEVRHLLFKTAKGNKEIKFNDEVFLYEQAKNELRGLEEIYFSQNLAERPYAERKLIFPVDDIFKLSSISQSQVMPVNISSLTANANLIFPLGHPQSNQLYVAHPYNPNTYLHYDNYEIEILQDKLREFSEIAQALGATEIDVKVISNSGHKTESRTAVNLNGKVDHWMAEMTGSLDRNCSHGEEVNLEHIFNRHQTFVPKSSIQEPKDTVWLQGEPSWQRLIKQRKEGGLTSHKEVIETRSSRVLTGSASSQLKGELKTLFVDLGLEWNKNDEYRYSEHNNLVLSVELKFQSDSSTRNLAPQADTLTHNELEYKNEFEACLKDGQVSASERRLLSRLARGLGLTEQQVHKIENLSLVPLSDEEKEYLEEYYACIADDPDLTPSTRRLLKKIAYTLGLTEEQIRKLESMPH